MQQVATTRESGYYWVKLGGDFIGHRWEIAEYRSWHPEYPWFVTDHSGGFSDKAIAEVGDRLIRPNEVNNPPSVEALIKELLKKNSELIANLQDNLVKLIHQKNSYCKERNALLVPLAKALIALGYSVGLGKHDPNDTTWDKEWRNIVYLEFPDKNGTLPVQGSWHIHDSELENFSFLPAYKESWDGHSTEEKYKRVQAASFHIEF